MIVFDTWQWPVWGAGSFGDFPIQNSLCRCRLAFLSLGSSLKMHHFLCGPGWIQPFFLLSFFLDWWCLIGILSLQWETMVTRISLYVSVLVTIEMLSVGFFWYEYQGPEVKHFQFWACWIFLWVSFIRSSIDRETSKFCKRWHCVLDFGMSQCKKVLGLLIKHNSRRCLSSKWISVGNGFCAISRGLFLVTCNKDIHVCICFSDGTRSESGILLDKEVHVSFNCTIDRISCRGCCSPMGHGGGRLRGCKVLAVK